MWKRSHLHLQVRKQKLRLVSSQRNREARRSWRRKMTRLRGRKDIKGVLSPTLSSRVPTSSSCPVSLEPIERETRDAVRLRTKGRPVLSTDNPPGGAGSALQHVICRGGAGLLYSVSAGGGALAGRGRSLHTARRRRHLESRGPRRRFRPRPELRWALRPFPPAPLA